MLSTAGSGRVRAVVGTAWTESLQPADEKRAEPLSRRPECR